MLAPDSVALADLGFDEGWARMAGEHAGAGHVPARVTAVDRGRFLLHDAHGERPAILPGRMEHLVESSADLPCVGDWVCADRAEANQSARIHHVLPRRSFLRRKAAGRDVDYQMLAANVDVAFVIQGCDFDFNVRRLERYLVTIREGHVEPVVLLTKTDLLDPGDVTRLEGEIDAAGVDVRVVAVSNVTGEGVDRVREMLVPRCTYCLLGSSGVGKTTLTNRLVGAGDLATGDVSRTGEGRHTTTRRRLIGLDGGALLIDLPGMRELGLLGAGEGLDDAFGDVGALAARCRYSDCSHASEPGCAVRAAISAEELDEGRLEGYLKLRREVAFNDLSYVDRRRKDRDFGRLVRGVLKEKSRRRDT